MSRHSDDGTLYVAIAIVIVFAVMVQNGIAPIIAGILAVAAFTGGIVLTGTVGDLL